MKKFFGKWWKRARMFARLFLFRIGLDNRPVFAVLTVTPHCNFKCKYCFADYHARLEKDLLLDDIIKIIDKLHDAGVIYLNVHGGEALLRKDIGTIINYALKKGMFVNLITNGALLEKRWDDVKGVDVICISVDGVGDNNDKNRGTGTYKIATGAVDFALSHGMTVRLGMTITQHTKHDIEQLAKWAKERHVYIHPYLLFDQENLPRELWMTRDENHDALRRLIALKKEGYPIFYGLKTLEYALRWPYEKSVLAKHDLAGLRLKSDFKFIPCMYRSMNVLVESNGTIRACNAITRNIVHVNILDKDIRGAQKMLGRENDCLYCYHLPQMEMSLLMSLDIRSVLGQFVRQVREDIKSLMTKKARSAAHE